jgi:hypothetical protein
VVANAVSAGQPGRFLEYFFGPNYDLSGVRIDDSVVGAGWMEGLIDQHSSHKAKCDGLGDGPTALAFLSI